MTDDSIVVELTDGRTLSVPLEWYPTLRNASPEQRTNLRLIGNGLGIHWEELDEDLSVAGMLNPPRHNRSGAPGSGQPENVIVVLPQNAQVWPPGRAIGHLGVFPSGLVGPPVIPPPGH